jgi:hypothetical protein
MYFRIKCRHLRLPLNPAIIICMPLIAKAIAVIMRSRAKPNFGYTKTSIDKDVINTPVARVGKLYDSSSFFFKPVNIRMFPLASKPNPRKSISHFVAISGKKNPEYK